MRQPNKTLPNRTIEDMHRPYVLDDLTPLWKLELVMLGALIANKTLRKEVELTDFTNEEIRNAVADLNGVGVVPEAYIDLKQAMRQLGVAWDGYKSPLPAMVERLKVCGDYNRALAELSSLFVGTKSGGDAEMRAVVEAVKRMKEQE